MFKSLYRYIYELLTAGPLKKALKAVTTKYPWVDVPVRKVQVALFDAYFMKPRLVRYRSNPGNRILFVDVSFLVLEDVKTGIQRVTRSILLQLLKQPPEGFDIQAVYGDRYIGYQPAVMTHDNGDLLTLARSKNEDPIEVSPGDIFLGLDYAAITTLKEQSHLLKLRAAGIKVYFVVYDLLPIQFPSYFPASTEAFHVRWLRAVTQFDGAVCISKAVADDFDKWIAAKRMTVSDTFKTTYFHLGADLENSSPTKGMPAEAAQTLQKISERPTFLMVGTLEPRKGYRLILDAFSQLWAANENVNLLIVGKIGWNTTEVADIIAQHPELNKKLFWLKGISDEYLEKIYASSTCLIAASEGEGFGLPIIEAAQHGISLMLRDIPVFREVAGASAFYFAPLTDTHTRLQAAQNTAESVKTWLSLYQHQQQPLSSGLRYNTWQQSVAQLKKSLSLP
jgi:glycosyltransferase involved in cell wall biosynthesis